MSGYSKKRPRTMRPDQIFGNWKSLKHTTSRLREVTSKRTAELTADPLVFFEQVLGFKPYEYQKEFTQLFVDNQFTAARWCRQSGKTYLISALLLWYAIAYPNSAIGIVGPSFRQTKRIISRIAAFTHKLPHQTVFKPQKTQIHFANGSTIEAFPNNPETIRGPTLHVVYCLPAGTNVTLADGSTMPIEKLKADQHVMSFNLRTNHIESKKVLRTFSNPKAGRTMFRITCPLGALDCTSDHKVYTVTKGFVPSSQVCKGDKILYLTEHAKVNVGDNNKTPSQSTPDRNPETVTLRWNFRRPLHTKTPEPEKKCARNCKSFFKTSTIRQVQVHNSKKCSKKTTHQGTQSRLGKVSNQILYFNPPRNNRYLPHLLPKRSQNRYPELAKPHYQPPCTSSMVYGRWQYIKISSKLQYTQIFHPRTVTSATMAQKQLENKRENCKRQPWQRLLSKITSKRPRLIFQSYKIICYSLNAIQDSPTLRVSSLLCMRKTRYPQQSSSLSQKTYNLCKQGMQKSVGKNKQRLETKSAKALCSMRKDIHSNSKKDSCLFNTMSKDIQNTIQETKTVTKQKANTGTFMSRVPQGFYSKKWSSENLQCKMQVETAQPTQQGSFATKTLYNVRKNFSASNSPPKILQCQVSGTECLPKKESEEEFVYDIEVEDNHNFFADGILVSNCDEMNFVANDSELYDAILYTLGTTDGKFVCSSTPWNTDSVFFKIFNHKDYKDFKTSHVPVAKALSPNGPLKPNIIQHIKIQMGDDPIRWRREMEAEWAEDQDVWLNQSLIAQCISTQKSCGQELREFNSEKTYSGEFYAGLDLAQTRDYTVLSVIERQNDLLFLRHLKIFDQPTIYATVLGYIKMLQDRWGGFERLRVDFTREGPSIIADMENAGIQNAEGVNFSVPRKSEMASLLKQRMLNRQFFYPLMTWEKPYRSEICNELNIERYTLRKDGSIGFFHPQGTHDDVFWSIALAVYATTDMAPEPYLAVVPRS